MNAHIHGNMLSYDNHTNDGGGDGNSPLWFVWCCYTQASF